MTIPVDDVVRYIVRMGDLYDDGDSITNMKLQKLLYYFQGYHLAAFSDQALFKNCIEAWEHGPVVPDVWEKYTDLGRMPIRIAERPEIPYLSGLEEPQLNLMKNVYDSYGRYSAWRLRQMTHKERPWRVARSRGDRSGNYLITLDDLSRFFRRKLIK